MIKAKVITTITADTDSEYDALRKHFAKQEGVRFFSDLKQVKLKQTRDNIKLPKEVVK